MPSRGSVNASACGRGDPRNITATLLYLVLTPFSRRSQSGVAAIHSRELIMRRLILTSLAVTLVLTLSCFYAYSQDQGAKVTDEFRRDFIKNFRKHGLSTTPGDAMFLRILVENGKLKRGIEVGSAFGYGAINMGIAFERNAGQLISLDIDPEMVKTSRDNIQKMGLEKTCAVIEGDALKILPTLEGEFDFIFIDALKRDYLKYLQAVLPKLKPGSLVIADNVIQSAREMKDYLEFVQNDKEFDTVIVRSSMDKNDGMAVSYKLK